MQMNTCSIFVSYIKYLGLLILIAEMFIIRRRYLVLCHEIQTARFIQYLFFLYPFPG